MVNRSRVIDELRNSQKDDKTAITFFYFNRNTHSTAVDFINSIIRQLLTQLDAIPDRIVAWYERNRMSTPTRPALPEAIQALNRFNEKYSTIFIVVDALDETPEEERRQIIRTIDGFVQQPSPFKLCITSRHEPDISAIASALGPSIYLSDHEDEITHAIRRFVSANLMSNLRMARLIDERMKDEIISTLSERSGGM